MLGQPADVIFTPEDRNASVPGRELETARIRGRAQDRRWHMKKDGSRFWADGILMRLQNEEDGMLRFAKVLRDATEQKQVEDAISERTRMAALISDVGIALTTRHTLTEMLRGCAEALVTHLDAAFARIWTLNDADSMLELQASAGQYVHLHGPHGRVPVGQFKIGLIAQERLPHLTNDVLHDPRVSDPEWAAREGMVAFAGYPLILQDRLVGVAALFARRPLSSVTLQGLGSVAAQIAVGIDRRRAEEDLRVRAESEALLNRVNEAIRATTDPEEIQSTVANLLGEALGADRCYFSVYDRTEDAVRIARDWRRPGLPSVAGEYHLTEYRQYVDELYAHGTAVIEDAQNPAVPSIVRGVLSGFGIRAFLAVPLLEGGRFQAAVAASMNGGPRQWTDAEIALMESALTQTRMAVEAARTAARERNISHQLQTALQPELPGIVPGLALTKHYKAALAEAGVGGDFYDVFALEKGRTALVIGDLSGKGLAAASQVATVRNMLRAFLYTRPTLADAAEALNWTLAEHGLLTGFATLFVGLYDSGIGELRYVNMGQEPALLRRAETGAVEQLEPTGPILGAIENARFAEGMAILKPGDALAIFTDGVTEVGESRNAMLGIEGVAALFASSFPAHDSNNSQERAENHADLLAQRLIAGVEAAARGGVMRDDVCLLVAVTE